MQYRESKARGEPCVYDTAYRYVLTGEEVITVEFYLCEESMLNKTLSLDA